MRVYIATAFRNWPEAKRVAGLLAVSGVQCSASWIMVAEARAGMDASDLGFAEECHRQNYTDLDESDALLMLRTEWCGEAFFEAYYAMYMLDIPVLWVGRPILSVTVKAGDANVRRMPSVEEAVAQLAWMSKRHAVKGSK